MWSTHAPFIDALTVVGVFTSGTAAREAARRLERAGFPPDRIGIVAGNVRQAREVAGSYSPQGALAGALLGALLVAAFVIFGGEMVRQNPFSVVLGGVVLVVAFTAIGWLAGRARVFKEGEYEEFEAHVEQGDVLVSVVCETGDGVEGARAMLERAGASEIRVERSGEAV
jgi:heat induced stress protein YflT